MPHGPCGAFSFSLAVPLFLLHSFVFFFFFALLFYSSSIFFFNSLFFFPLPFSIFGKESLERLMRDEKMEVLREFGKVRCWEERERGKRGWTRRLLLPRESVVLTRDFFLYLLYLQIYPLLLLFRGECGVFVYWKLGEKSFLLDPLVRASSPNLFGCFLKVPWIYFLGI